MRLFTIEIRIYTAEMRPHFQGNFTLKIRLFTLEMGLFAVEMMHHFHCKFTMEMRLSLKHHTQSYVLLCYISELCLV